jgi:hypothetical protein
MKENYYGQINASCVHQINVMYPQCKCVCTCMHAYMRMCVCVCMCMHASWRKNERLDHTIDIIDYVTVTQSVIYV